MTEHASGTKHKRWASSTRGSHARLIHNRLFRTVALLRRHEPVPGILAARRPGAIMDKSQRRFVTHWKTQPKLVTSNTKSVTYVLSLKCYPCLEPTHQSPFTNHQSPLTSQCSQPATTLGNLSLNTLKAILCAGICWRWSVRCELMQLGSRKIRNCGAW